jgi:4,5-dihydroxyphthalate decarboxylase
VKVVLGRDDLAGAATSAVREIGTQVERLDIRPVNRAARGMVGESSADICELPIVTLLQAAAQDRPVLLLPITALGRFQHQTLVTCGDLTVADVEGRSVGVRSWSQTTGVWMRGFLSEQYGVDLRKVDWVVYEGGHVDGQHDPSWVHRAPEGDRLPADFLEGRVDFGIMGNELPKDDRIRTAVPDAAQAGAAWTRDKGFVPVNHVVAVSEKAAREHADAVCAAYDAMAAVLATTPSGFNPVGFEALRGPVSQAAAYALEQDALARPVDFDELVARSCAALGVPASRLGG